MILEIDMDCRRCNKTDSRQHTISDWSKAEALLEVDTNWQCPWCGCRAAYWSFCRNPKRENLPKGELIEAQRHSYPQLFGQTIDSLDNKYNKPLSIEISKKQPDTREELSTLRQ